MMSNNIKRCLSLVMALVMVFSLLPFQAFATEMEAHDHGTETEVAVEITAVSETDPESEDVPDTNLDSKDQSVSEPEAQIVPEEEDTEDVDAPDGNAVENTSAPAGETVLETTAQEAQARMEALLLQYGVVSDMTDEEIINSIIAADGDTLQTTMQEIDEIEALLAEFEDEDASLFDMVLFDTYDRFCQNLQMLMTPALLATDVGTVLNGQISVTATLNSTSNGKGTCSISGNVVTIKSNGDRGWTDSREEQVVTLTNETSSKATLYFDYTITNDYDYVKINDESKTSSGYFNDQIDSGGSVTIKTKGKRGTLSLPAALTLVLSNFSLTPVAEKSSVVVNFDSTLGSVTVDGTAISTGDTIADIAEGNSIVLAANTNSGTTFHGWIDTEDGRILSTATSYTLTPTADMTVKAVFTGANSAPHFMVGAATEQTFKTGLFNTTSNTYYTVSGSYIFDDLNKADAAAAASSTNKAIVLMNSGTLPAGDYEISTGNTLLIPYDSANTMYTTAPESSSSYSNPTNYRTMTMASGANLVINGSMSLSAKHLRTTDASKGGAPTGACSFVKMESGSSIEVNGALYAYGFIYGSGTVTANKNATVYELFQIRDFRGGSQSTKMENGVFPLSQYYVQNIEVPLTIMTGATEYAYTTVYASSTTIGTGVSFISSSNAMFNLTDGSVTKTYDGSKDRLNIDLNGTTEIASIALTLMAGAEIDSADYDLALNSNITINVNAGSSAKISQDLALLPGSEVNVHEGATCTLSSGNSVYVYDADQWDTYVWSGVKFQPVAYAPGKTYTRTEADLVDAKVLVNGTVNASAGNFYTTTGGAQIYSTSDTGVVNITTRADTVTYQLIQSSETYVEIAVTSAKLQNADSSYVATSETGLYYYSVAHGEWVKDGHTDVSETPVAATCTTQGYTENVCKCGYEYNDAYTDALSHLYNAGVVTTQPTCTTAGVKTFTCTRTGCSHSYTETIAATGHSYTSVVTAPTCTEAGYTTHTCTCGYSYTDSEVAALGHSYTTTTDAPTYTTAGSSTSTCSECGDTATTPIIVAKIGETEYTILSEAITAAAGTDTVVLQTTFDETEPLVVSQELTINKNGYAVEIEAGVGYGKDETDAGIVTIWKRIIAGTSVRAGDCLDIYFYVTGLEGDGYTAKITRDGEVDKEIPSSEWLDAAPYRRFAYTGIAAKEMTDVISVTIYEGENVVSETATESIEAYALRTLEKRSGKELQTALVDMLNYGADAQTHFGHNTSNLANANLSAEEKKFATEADATLTQSMTGTTTGNVTFAGASVTAGTTLYLNFFFKGITEADKSDYRAVLTYTDHYGTDKECKISGSAFVNTSTSDGIAVFGPQLTGLAAADGRQPVSCTIYKGEEPIAVANASVEGYVNTTIGKSDKETLIAVCKSLMKFVDSANAYFRSLES